jgi:SPP1 family phage portal protein
MTTSYDFKALITAHEDTRNAMIADYQAYCIEGLAILSRTMSDSTKINNKLVNDFRGEIVDQIVGYLFGRPITYSLDKEKYGSNASAYDKDNAEFDAFLKRVEIADLDAETGKRHSIMGSVFRLCYIDADGNENIQMIFPWQVVYIDEHNAFIYQQDAETNRYTVQYYDDMNITTYVENNEGEFVEDVDNPVRPHMFQLMPIIEFVNNDERIGDFHKVEPLIDAYDRTLSDAQNEVEEFRQAYLALIGLQELDADTITAARAAGAFALPENSDAKFLTKEINDDFLEHHKQTLRENIYRFSATVDMTDQKFSGSDQSGEARKWKLLALENKAAIKERKFAKSLRQMFRVLATAWQVKGFTLSADNINFVFDRNIPLELSMEADTTNKLKGMVSERTRLSNLSIVNDVEREIEEMQAEQTVDLDVVDTGDDNNMNGDNDAA